MSELTPLSYRFDLRTVLKKYEMSERDWKTANFVKRRIHGLTLHPTPAELERTATRLFHPSAVKTIISELYDKYKTPLRDLVAYKGGTLEKDILIQLGIPHVDLETHRCPKFEDLTDENQMCPYHVVRTEKIHCPAFEVFTFDQVQTDSCC